MPRLMMACAVGITVIHSIVMLGSGCSSPQTHQSIELGAYAAEKSLCVDEATSRDAGEACLTAVSQKYAPFWDGGAK